MSSFSFKIDHLSNTGARTGIIFTPHGKIKTPSFVAVGTQATVKSLTPMEIKDAGVQIFFVNTYHMLLRPGIKVIEKFGGLHKFMAWPGPLMTDSGGFQVFSLGRRKKFGKENEADSPSLVKIDKDGVFFRSHWDGKLYQLTPEKSISVQHLLRADIMIAFDDCTPYPVDYQTAKNSLERTHLWAVRSLKTHKLLQKKSTTKQALYGSIQGSVFETLRKNSAKFISSLPFDGIAIGGVSVGESKAEMEKVLSWVTPLLPSNKPRHLLGVGEIDDIFTLVKYGIDTFDCVMPTRLGRMGHALVKNKKGSTIDIIKKIYAEDKKPIEENCRCYTCSNFSKGYLNHLFRVRELLGYRLLTIHNLHFIENLMEKIRKAIKDGNLEKIQKEYIK